MNVYVLAGNVVRCVAEFDPESPAVVDPLGVTCRYESPRRAIQTLTVVADSATQFHADVVVPDDEARGDGLFRWESASPKISGEVKFTIRRSSLPNP